MDILENGNWLLIVILIFLVFSILNGFRRGLVRTAFAMVSLILLMILISFLSPHISDLIKNHTPVYQAVEDKCSQLVENKMTDYIDENIELGTSEQMGIIENLPLPESLKNYLSENNNNEVYKLLNVDSFSGYIAAYMANGLINGLSYLLAFLLAEIILKLIVYSLDIMTRLPILHGINRLGGFVLGGVQGMLVVWIGFLVLTLFCGTPWGLKLMEQVNESAFLSYLYDHNFLITTVMKLF
ncbi:MAG: CvpA family protein [Lachnospiraceae bacterium]|nr:CvpA family protein [Lachnospiraceae bacterium]MDD3616252.1 CvpA family protein [Lachnospiraceae bacterium]